MLGYRCGEGEPTGLFNRTRYVKLRQLLYIYLLYVMKYLTGNKRISGLDFNSFTENIIHIVCYMKGEEKKYSVSK